MYLLLLAVLGTGLLGGDFVKLTILHIPLIYIVMAGLLVSYMRFVFIKNGRLALSRGEKGLIVFVFYGLLMAVLSFIGVNRFLVNSGLFISKSYIPRQAYYLFILPACILFKDTYYTTKFDEIIKKFGTWIFWACFVFVMWHNHALHVSAQIVLCWLSLYMGKTNKRNNKTKLGKWHCILRSAVLFLSPLPADGTSTAIIIRMMFLLVLFFHKKRKRTMLKVLYLAVIGLLCFSFFLPLLFPNGVGFGGDNNIIWRIRYWEDELISTARSGFLGVGYGTTYATNDFINFSLDWSEGGGPFGADEWTTSTDKAFVTGSHNSFISLTFRLGLIGIVSFLVFLFEMYKRINLYVKFVSPATYFMFFASIFLIGFNVGLESPYYLLIFVFAMGKCVQETRGYSHSIDISNGIKCKSLVTQQ